MKRFAVFLLVAGLSCLQGSQSPHLGEKLPELSMKDASGEEHTLRQYRGQYVMLFTLGYG